MVDVYARLDTAHGDGGAQLPRQAPHLYGKTIEDVEPLETSSRVETAARGMGPDRNAEEVLTTDAEAAGAMTEKPIPTGAQKLANEADESGEPQYLGPTTVLGDATMGHVEGASPLDKSAAAAADDADDADAARQAGPKSSTSSTSDMSGKSSKMGDDAVTGTFTVDEAKTADDPKAPLLSKSALNSMGKPELVKYAESRNIDCTGANKEEIIAALYGE